jgi:hypothetical protein
MTKYQVSTIGRFQVDWSRFLELSTNSTVEASYFVGVIGNDHQRKEADEMEPILLNKIEAAIRFKLQLPAEFDQGYAKGQKQAHNLLLPASEALDANRPSN